MYVTSVTTASSVPALTELVIGPLLPSWPSGKMVTSTRPAVPFSTKSLRTRADFVCAAPIGLSLPKRMVSGAAEARPMMPNVAPNASPPLSVFLRVNRRPPKTPARPLICLLVIAPPPVEIVDGFASAIRRLKSKNHAGDAMPPCGAGGGGEETRSPVVGRDQCVAALISCHTGCRNAGCGPARDGDKAATTGMVGQLGTANGTSSKVPLVINLDGALLKSDLQDECALQLARRDPGAIFQILYWLGRGHVAFRQFIAARGAPEIEGTPARGDFVAWTESE